MRSQIEFIDHLPDLSENSQNYLLIYDSIFDRKPEIKKWIQKFPFRLSVKSGENLKTLSSFSAVLKKISTLKISKSTQLTFVALGGGTIGDFVGFLASTYMRGRGLILIPSTWLAAVDSAHGGKNGLNFEKAKNQIGTIYAPDKIYISKYILQNQPAQRLNEAMGEIIKISVLNDRSLFEKLESQSLQADQIFALMPRITKNKYAIVSKDPFEKKGMRRLLNLGHTMGHVFESQFQIPHGAAVLLGLEFSAKWSFATGLLSENEFIRIVELVSQSDINLKLRDLLIKIPQRKIQLYLAKDKKITSRDVLDFIFIKKIGQCIRLSVSILDILAEVKRQRSEY